MLQLGLVGPAMQIAKTMGGEVSHTLGGVQSPPILILHMLGTSPIGDTSARTLCTADQLPACPQPNSHNRGRGRGLERASRTAQIPRELAGLCNSLVYCVPLFRSMDLPLSTLAVMLFNVYISDLKSLVD